MPATMKQLDPTRVEVEIPIAPEDLEAARNHAFRELSKKAKIPGFRPGHIPRGIFEQHYGRRMIEERALDDLVPKVYSKALEELDLYPLANPDVEILPSESEGAPMRVKATVTVQPPIELVDYRGLEVAEQEGSASDDDVDESLEALRREAAILVPVDRPVQIGDVVTIDYEGKIDGEPFEGGQAEKSTSEVEEGRFIPGFIEGIVGMKAGETKTTTITFPQDYPKSELAGKEATFTITVHEVKERELPAMNDALAERIAGRPMTLLELKMDLRRRLDAVANAKVRRAMTSQLVEKLLEIHDFPLPVVLVEREIDALVEDAKTYAARSGQDWSTFLERSGKTEQEIREGFRPDAERRVKTSLLLGAIAKAEGVEASPADFERELDHLAQQYQQPREQILELLGPHVGSLVAGIVRTKTLDMLLDAAKITKAPATADAQA